MRDLLEHLLRTVTAPDPERVEQLWAEYSAGGAEANAAFATLLGWYGTPIYRRIWGFVRSDAADDVFQEVLAALHLHRRKLPTFTHAQRWLRTVADRKALDAHRRATRRQRREVRAARPESTSTEQLTRESVETQQALAAALSRLTDEQRQAVALHYFEGLDKQAAAAVLGVHRDTLAKRLNEALAELRKWLPVAGVLATAAPTLSAERLAELAARACLTTAGVNKPVMAIAVALVVCGVVVAGVVANSPPTPTPATVAAADEPAVVELESVPDRNLRVFRAEVLPRQLIALKGVVLGDGEVELARVEAFDTRLWCEYAIRHRVGGVSNWVSKLSLWHNTIDRSNATYFDTYDRGDWTLIDSQNEGLSVKLPLIGTRFLIRFKAGNDARAEFARLPCDDRTAAEFRESVGRMERKLAPFLGIWYVRGDVSQRCRVWVEKGGQPDGSIQFRFDTGTQSGRPLWLC